MKKIDCSKCDYFIKNLYSNNENRPDSRCTHSSARVGHDDEPPYKVQSYLTIREARLPRSDRKENFPERVREYDQCGPNAQYFSGAK